MADKIYLNLLLFCGILFQGITGTVTNEDNKKSSDILVRQKRVICREPDEDIKESITGFPYIVRIKHNNRVNCVGSILTQYVVITIPLCVRFHDEMYQVFSNSRRSEFGNVHEVKSIRTRYSYHPNKPMDGIALLVVDPPFVFGSYTNKIELHTGPLLPGAIGTVSGWGHNGLGINSGTQFPRNLRSIKVPIMAHRDCVDIYRHHNIVITDKDICTYHPQKYCGHTDGGAPLVIDGFLAGVHVWTGLSTLPIDREYPDVFAIVQHIYYSNWIRENVRQIEARFENRHK